MIIRFYAVAAATGAAAAQSLSSFATTPPHS
jgi:hypothetical protein